MFHTNMTVEQIMDATKAQRARDIAEARMWRDHYQGVLDRLEGRKEKPEASVLRKHVEYSEMKA